MPVVRSKNERVELEMKIMKCRRLASPTDDERFVKRIQDHIAELERSSGRSTSELARYSGKKGAGEQRDGRKQPNLQIRQ